LTLATTSNKTIVAGNGITTSFTFPFPVPQASELFVYYTDTNGNQSLLLASSYTINSIGSPNGGSITYPLAGAPIAVGTTLTIERVVTYQQLSSYENQSAYYPDVIEASLDYLTMQTQQLAEITTRAITVPISAQIPNLVLPGSAAARANTIIGFDANGNVEVLPASASIGAGNMTSEGPFVANVNFTPGVTTTLLLSQAYGTSANVAVHFDGIYQGTDQYALSGTSIVFTSPIPVGVGKVYIVGGTTLSQGLPAARSVGDLQIQWGTIVSRDVDTITALRSLSSSVYNRARVQSYSVLGNGGGGDFWFNPADTTSTDNGVTIIVASDNGRWYRINENGLSLTQAGADKTGGTDSSTALQFMATNSPQVSWTLPDGTFAFNSQITFDYTAPGFPIDQQRSPRATIKGSMANSILIYGGSGFAWNLISNVSTQGFNGFDCYYGFTLCPNVSLVTNGISLNNKQYFKFQDVNLARFISCMEIQSCYSFELENIHFNNCSTGLIFGDSGLGPINAAKISNAFFTSCTGFGILGNSIGQDVSLRNIVVENCGTQGNNSTGGMNLTFGLSYGNSGPFIIDNAHFEANAGFSDVSIINESTTELTVVFLNCEFSRSYNNLYTLYNIFCTNAGGGRIKCILIGCNFTSNNTYVPSGARPFVNGDANTEIIDLGCSYTESTSRITSTHGRVTGGQVTAAGGTNYLPPQITCVRSGAGTYNFTHNVAFAKDVNSYVVTATANTNAAGAFVGRVINRTASTFTVVTVNNAATPTDTDFSFMILQQG
jgi:hypothetical protein